MASRNFTGGEKLKTIIESYCSDEINRGVRHEFVFLSVLNAIFSVTAFLGNTLILAVLHKETSLHPRSKLLYRNLALTDLFVGIIAEPAKVAHWISAVGER